jgi:hypothetical protein
MAVTLIIFFRGFTISQRTAPYHIRRGYTYIPGALYPVLL